MDFVVHNLYLGLDEPQSRLATLAARKLRVRPADVRQWRIVRKSLDARPGRMQWTFSVAVALDPARHGKVAKAARSDVRPYAPPTGPALELGAEPLDGPVAVVGAGPAGLFAALVLAEAGYRPILIDRGRDVAQRHRDVADYVRERHFHPESNYLFGEGGAGAYSDGKLYTRVHDGLVGWVVEQFVAFGADAEVAIAGKPHVGSDRLPLISRAMRERVEQLGGQVRYGTRVDGLEIAAGRLRGLRLSDGQVLAVGAAVLAIGHSARDTYAMLARTGVTLQAKPFQMGVRIEHPQELIDAAQRGALAGRADLGPADYHLVARGSPAVYSFCMCPGGEILPAHHQAEAICTNGGSRMRRDSGWANAALVVTVAPDQFGDDPLEGLALQERIERACFAAAGGDYSLAAQRVEDFLAGRAPGGPIATTSLTGATGCDFDALLPPFLSAALRRALPEFDARIPGFAGPAGVLLGPETRASSPVRILRDAAARTSPAAENLYPAGEGAGYAGGIVSSAVDGLRSAEALIRRFAPPR